jgi:uncharacterized protein (TIGR03083 family)
VQISPRYSGPPAVDVSATIVPDPVVPLIRQRERLARELSGLTDEQWRLASRCAGWTVQDVAEHIAGVNAFWALSIEAGLRGEPTRYLVDFDPVAVPAAMVQAARGDTPAVTLDRLITTNAALESLLDSLAESDWSMRAEAPPGHITIRWQRTRCGTRGSTNATCWFRCRGPR